MKPQKKARKMRQLRVRCRLGLAVAYPCAWSFEGYCGADGKRCVLGHIISGNFQGDNK